MGETADPRVTEDGEETFEVEDGRLLYTGTGWNRTYPSAPDPEVTESEKR